MKNIRNSKFVKYLETHKYIYVTLIMFPFIVMSNFTTFRIDDTPYKFVLGLIRMSLCFVMLFLFIKKHKKPSALLLILAIIELWLVATTFLNNFIYMPVLMFRAIVDTVSAIMIGLTIEYYLDEVDSLINGLMIDYEIAIYANFISILKVGPELFGERNFYFLEYYTALSLWFIPAIGIACLYYFRSTKKIRSVVLTIVVLISVALTQAATTTVAFLGIVAVIIAGLLIKNQKLFSLAVFASLIVLLNIFIVFVFSGGRFPIIDSFIENVLHRDITFTGRTRVWEQALLLFKEKPLIGFGHGAVVDFGYEYITASHNELIQRLFITGIIGFVLFVLFNFVMIKKIDENTRSIQKIVFIALISGIFLTYITEALMDYYRFYVVFFIAYHLMHFFPIKDRTNS